MTWRYLIALAAFGSVCQAGLLDNINPFNQKKDQGLPTDGQLMGLCRRLRNPAVRCTKPSDTLDDIIKTLDRDACKQDAVSPGAQNITVTLDLNFANQCRAVHVACGDKSPTFIQTVLGLVQCVLSNVDGVLNTVVGDVPVLVGGAAKNLGLTLSIALLIVREALFKVIDILMSGSSIVPGLLCHVLPLVLIGAAIALPTGMVGSNILVVLTTLSIVVSGLVGALTVLLGTPLCAVGAILGPVVGLVGNVVSPILKIIAN